MASSLVFGKYRNVSSVTGFYGFLSRVFEAEYGKSYFTPFCN
jgi:hypothetical protein